MSKYLVTLKPFDTFFFSQENKYRIKDSKFVSDYFQRSAYLPQQTAILGMLRYHLLQINQQIPIEDEQKSSELIGIESFSTQRDNAYGKIKSISPVFILKNKSHEQTYYITNPKDLLLNNDNDDLKTKYMKYSKLSGIKSNIQNSNDFIFFKDYNEKRGLDNFLININNENDFVFFEKNENTPQIEYVFMNNETIGIKKGRNGKAQENSFFKQIIYKMNKDYSFAFFADIDETIENLSKQKIVVLGTEKNIFQISFREENENFYNSINFSTVNSPKIILLSDTFLENDVYKYSAFAITETIPFRYLETKLNKNPQYYYSNPIISMKNAINNKMHRSNRFNLIRRGSVFYFDSENNRDTFAEKILLHKNFYKIGYNYFKTI